jgi:hypothetical protein
LIAALLGLAGCVITALNNFNLALSISPLAFFGPYCLLIGYLVLRSAFVPRILGVLMMLAGLGWLIFLTPAGASYLASYIKVVGVVGEGALMLWLLLIGVDVQRWKEQAKAA